MITSEKNNFTGINFLQHRLFWDIDPQRLDLDLNNRLIIERIFMLGNKSQIQALIRYYGLDVIRREIVHAGNLDPKTINWVSKILHIPKKKFTCYIKRQSTTIHGNF